MLLPMYPEMYISHHYKINLSQQLPQSDTWILQLFHGRTKAFALQTIHSVAELENINKSCRPLSTWLF